ncbi:MAG: c-type cytochrome [Saprospiraceae bacterium]|nr:c-type cytochrome [Saprospiraceae bacterium]
MVRFLMAIIGLVALQACQDKEVLPYDYFTTIPKGFPSPAIPPDNEVTADRIQLGRSLFYDPVLSADSSRSCASYHRQQFAFADNVAFSEGIKGRKATRNSPSLGNVVYQEKLLREGGLSSLEMQVLVPVQEHNEFDFNLLKVAARLKRMPYYVDLAAKAYGRQPDEYVITRAIATFERSLFSGESRYDDFFYNGKTAALTATEKRGKDLFFSEKTSCSKCHSGFLFTNQTYANNGLYEIYPDEGRMRLTGKPEDNGVFKIPSLRNVGVTAPYMFDGSLAALDDVIKHYETGGIPHINKHPEIKPFQLTPEERKDLIAFLESLTDVGFLTNPDFGPN